MIFYKLISQSNPQFKNPAVPLLILLDGVGLSIILACTCLDWVDMWYDFFIEYADYNITAMCLLFSGHIVQFLGLLYLIIYNTTFHMFPEFESNAMVFLTVGPLLNMASCSLFTTTTMHSVHTHSSISGISNSISSGGSSSSGSTTSFSTSFASSTYHFNRRWMVSEIWELLGICLLNVALLPSLEPHHLHALCFEVVAYVFLAFSVILDFNFTVDESVSSLSNSVDEVYYRYPVVEIKTDSLIHMTDCFGLFLLVLVSFGQYYVKLAHSRSSTKAA